MAEGRVLIKKSTLTEIGNAIREKTGTSALINPDNMPQEIESIKTGITPSGTLDITENGVYDVTDKASVNVNVPSITTEEWDGSYEEIGGND